MRSVSCPAALRRRRLALGGLLALVAGCTTAAPAPDAPSLTVSPQPAAASVTIDEAFLPGPGFVVIHATDAEGKPLVPASIGAAPIPAGRSSNLIVTLTELVSPGDRLIAMLHVDTGQAGVYEFGATSIAYDKPVMYAGKPVTATIVLE